MRAWNNCQELRFDPRFEILRRGVLMKTIDNLSLRDNEKKAIQEATRMLKEKFPVKEVILFGSKARGDDDEDSDIDLLLLTTCQIH